MTDVTPIDRASRRLAAKMERQAEKDRAVWWRNFIREMQGQLGRQLAQIRDTDPSFEARMLSGFACNISLHLLSSEDMADLERRIAAGEFNGKQEAEPTGLLDAQGEPIVKADG